MRRSWRRRLDPAIPGGIAVLAALLLGVACDGPAPPTTAQSPLLNPSGEPAIGTAAPSVATSPSGRTLLDWGGAVLLLAGRPGSMSLQRLASDGTHREIDLPDPDASWVSTDVDGHVLVTLADGRAFRAGSVTTAGDPGWTSLGGAATTATGHRALGTLSPDGTTAAFVAADYGSGAPAELAVVDVELGAQQFVALGRSAEGAPPVWLDGQIVVLVRDAHDVVGSVVVDFRSGRVSTGPGPAAPPGDEGWSAPILALSSAADGSKIAIVSRLDLVPEIRPAGSWLAGRPTTAERLSLSPEADGSRTFAWLTLAPAGDALAIVRTNADGETVEVTVALRSAGWAETSRLGLPTGANRAVAAWLP